jgi:hypothetical protein
VSRGSSRIVKIAVHCVKEAQCGGLYLSVFVLMGGCLGKDLEIPSISDWMLDSVKELAFTFYSLHFSIF